MEEYIQPISTGLSYSVEFVFAAMLLSFLLCSLVGTTYRLTYQGLSYSRSFVQTQLLAGLITAILIMAIGNNLARGLGILGTLAIIRFRTPVRDPRDIIFLFASITFGIACGAGVFLIATAGCLFFCLIAFYLHWSPFASKREYEGLLRFMLPKDRGDMRGELDQYFREYCRDVELVAIRDAVQGDFTEYAYQVRLHDPALRAELLDRLSGIDGVRELSLLMQRSTVEI